MQPSGTGFGTGAIFALGSALCYALFNILARKLSASGPSHTQLFWALVVLVLGRAAIIAASSLYILRREALKPAA